MNQSTNKTKKVSPSRLESPRQLNTPCIFSIQVSRRPCTPLVWRHASGSLDKRMNNTHSHTTDFKQSTSLWPLNLLKELPSYLTVSFLSMPWEESAFKRWSDWFTHRAKIQFSTSRFLSVLELNLPSELTTGGWYCYCNLMLLTIRRITREHASTIA